MMNELIGTSANNIKVTFDPIHSHAATHIEDTPNLKQLVSEVVTGLKLDGKEIARHFDMGKIIGVCDLVNVNSSNKIVYGVRKNREDDGLVPFVKDKKGEPCPFVAIHLLPVTYGEYILSSAWIGTFDEDDEPFPLSKNANERFFCFSCAKFAFNSFAFYCIMKRQQ